MRTWDEATPVMEAPFVTSPMLCATWAVRSDALWMLRAMSRVAWPWPSMAVATPEAISEMRPMMATIAPIAPTDSRVAVWMPAICSRMSSVASAVCLASVLTS